MSNKDEKVSEQTEEKKMTKYDLKMKRREEEKKREKRNKKISLIAEIVVVIAIIAFIASFPIRTYIKLNSAYFYIADKKITQVEFEYNYNLVKNNFLNNYGSYLSYMGIDTTQDITNQMYDDTFTWGNYFEQTAAESLADTKALVDEANKAGFEYDTTEEYNNYVEAIKQTASNEGVSLKEYIKETYGDLATLKRIAPFIKESIYSEAYYDEISEQKAPTDDEITAYYNENTQDYDNVDYYFESFEADLPSETDEDGNTIEPTDEEVSTAMADAKTLADDALEGIFTDGTLRENSTYSATTTVVRDWIFDEARKEGDKAVLEDTTNNVYYVVGFEKRYLPDEPSASANFVIINTEDSDVTGEDVLNEWKSGEATKESFEALADEYNSNVGASNEGGYFESLTSSGTPDEVSEWLFDESRVEGDTTSIDTDTGYTYVIYFDSFGDPSWKLTIKSTLTDEAMSAYVDEISESYEITDPKGNLDYLGVLKYKEAIDSMNSVSDSDADSTVTEDTEVVEETTDTETVSEDTTVSANDTVSEDEATAE